MSRPVVNENGIVLGVIGKRDWKTDPAASAEQLMGPAPTTLRPSDPLEKAKQLLSENDRGAVLVTDSDGKLLGAFFSVGDKKSPAINSKCRNRDRLATAQSVVRYQNIAMRIYPRHVIPECLNRRSSSVLTWIPDRSIRE